MREGGHVLSQLSANVVCPYRTCRMSSVCPYTKGLHSRRCLLSRKRIPKTSWKVSSSRNADTWFLSNHGNGPEPRCRACTARNEIHRSAWQLLSVKSPFH